MNNKSLDGLRFDLLQPELRNLARGWSTEKRRRMAAIYRRWADQLDLSTAVRPGIGGSQELQLAMLQAARAVN